MEWLGCHREVNYEEVRVDIKFVDRFRLMVREDLLMRLHIIALLKVR